MNSITDSAESRARSGRSRYTPLSRTRRIAINIFLLFHIIGIACWCLPLDTPLIPTFRNLLRPYFLWSGLFQSWDMFAPAPKAENSYVEAVVIYQDRSGVRWAFPRMEQLSLGRRLFEERYRKFVEVIQQEPYEPLLPGLARHIARANSTPGKPASTVVLIQSRSAIGRRADGSYEPQPWEQRVFFGYGVKPEDLK